MVGNEVPRSDLPFPYLTPTFRISLVVLFIIARQLQAIEASDNPQREFDVDPFLTDFLAILAYILAPIIIALLRPLAEHPLGLWDILLMVLVAVPVILHDITPQLDILFDATFPDKVKYKELP